VPSFQRPKNRRTLGGGASSRRNQNDRRKQGSSNLDLRRDRGVVSTLAFDRRRQTKLPKHSLCLSEAFQPNESRTDSSGGHGWIRFYGKVVRRLFGPACLYGQVIKTRRNDRIVKVKRRAVLGDRWRLEQALQNSEDSVKLNTSFVERLNLTIRQGSAYLGRRTISHTRCKKLLEDHLELLRCHYNPASYCLTSLCL
jgi:IS1 family transposase